MKPEDPTRRAWYEVPGMSSRISVIGGDASSAHLTAFRTPFSNASERIRFPEAASPRGHRWIGGAASPCGYFFSRG